jgi:hypothetical protein
MMAAACGKAGPSRSGEVWEIDPTGGRTTAPAAVLAYVNGLHLVIVDGDRAFSGVTELKTESAPGGGRTIALANGLKATLVPAGTDRMDLRFSSGESIPMQKKVVREVAKR